MSRREHICEASKSEKRVPPVGHVASPVCAGAIIADTAFVQWIEWRRYCRALNPDVLLVAFKVAAHSFDPAAARSGVIVGKEDQR